MDVRPNTTHRPSSKTHDLLNLTLKITLKLATVKRNKRRSSRRIWFPRNVQYRSCDTTSNNNERTAATHPDRHSDPRFGFLPLTNSDEAHEQAFAHRRPGTTKPNKVMPSESSKRGIASQVCLPMESVYCSKLRALTTTKVEDWLRTQ